MCKGIVEDDYYDYVVLCDVINYNGNQVTRIDDYDYSLTYPCYGGYHFIDYVQQNNEYSYDDNGNLTHED